MAKKKLVINDFNRKLVNVLNAYDIATKGWNPFTNYYSPIKLLRELDDTGYGMVVSKRSDGKSFAFKVIIYLAWQFCDYSSVIIRRTAEQIKPADLSRDQFLKIYEMFPQFNKKNYDGVMYYKKQWRGYWIDSKTQKRKYDDGFCEYCAVSISENVKSNRDIDNLFLILFDEFMSRDGYLPDEFVKYANLLSSFKYLTLTFLFKTSIIS